MSFTTEFHIFVFISTVVYFILLKRYKNDIEKNINSNNEPSSNLIYILFLPFILYSTQLLLKSNFFKKGNTQINKTLPSQNYNTYKPPSSDGLLSAPYPASSL